jgi:hypothetical protein
MQYFARFFMGMVGTVIHKNQDVGEKPSELSIEAALAIRKEFVAWAGCDPQAKRNSNCRTCCTAPCPIPRRFA